jgi:hypothetical protein
MASVGSQISAADYNAIRNKIIAVMGPGTTNPTTGVTDYTFGYGQQLMSSAVSEGQTITRAQFENLKNDILNARLHQDGTTPTITTVNVGDVVRYGATHPITQYDTLTSTAITNKFNLGTGYFSTVAVKDNVGTDLVMPITRTTSWSSSVSCNVTATFASANAMRYFFNSGGRINFNSSRTGGASTSQNNIWSSTLTSAGTQGLGSISSGNQGVNFYNLTTTDQIWYSITSSAPYASNTWRLRARLGSGAVGTSTFTATSIIFTITWTDGYTDPDTNAGNPALTNPPADVVDGTLNLTVTQTYAGSTSGINLLPVVTPPAVQPVWTITLPTYSNTAISGS